MTDVLSQQKPQPSTVVTTPSTQAFGDAAAIGTATDYARAAHKHAMPAGVVLANLPTVPEASAYHNANQSIATATWTIVALNSERLDSDTIHDTATNNSRLTCKTAGRYYVWVAASFGQNGTGGRTFLIAKNSGGTPAGGTYLAFGTQASLVTGNTSIAFGRIVPLAVNDYIELHVYQDSGGALALGGLAEYSPEVGMRWLGA